MAELKVKEIKQDAVTKDITVNLQILDGDQVIEKSYGFDSSLSVEEIQKELEKVLSTYHLDKEMFIRNAENDKKDKEFSHLKENLEGSTIK